MIAKCGEERIWQWAHRGRRLCDPWWENETEWHRLWKNQFPADWQEIVHYAEDGERHIADVKTRGGWAIEFQHSYIKPEERRSRDAFYPKLVWVVNGLRRKRDRAQFQRVWEEGRPIRTSAGAREVFSIECRILREWAETDAPVAFDFGDEEVLWWLLPKSGDMDAYVAPFPRGHFVQAHRRASTGEVLEFDAFVERLNRLVAGCRSHRSTPQVPQPRPPRDFEREFLLMGRAALARRPRRYRPGRFRR